MNPVNIESFDYNTEAWVENQFPKVRRDIEMPNVSIVVDKIPNLN